MHFDGTDALLKGAAGWGQKKKKKRELARLPAGGWVADQCTMVSPDEQARKKKKENERAPVFTDEKMVGGGAAARDGAPRVLPVSDQNARMGCGDGIDPIGRVGRKGRGAAKDVIDRSV